MDIFEFVWDFFHVCCRGGDAVDFHRLRGKPGPLDLNIRRWGLVN